MDVIVLSSPKVMVKREPSVISDRLAFCNTESSVMVSVNVVLLRLSDGLCLFSLSDESPEGMSLAEELFVSSAGISGEVCSSSLPAGASETACPFSLSAGASWGVCSALLPAGAFGGVCSALLPAGASGGACLSPFIIWRPPIPAERDNVMTLSSVAVTIPLREVLLNSKTLLPEVAEWFEVALHPLKRERESSETIENAKKFVFFFMFLFLSFQYFIIANTIKEEA